MSAFISQFQVMRNLLDLARDIAIHRHVVGFQMVSSLSAVRHAKESLVPEDCVCMDSVLLSGYGEAKWVCERMLDETLHKNPRCSKPWPFGPHRWEACLRVGSGVMEPKTSTRCQTVLLLLGISGSEFLGAMVAETTKTARTASRQHAKHRIQ